MDRPSRTPLFRRRVFSRSLLSFLLWLVVLALLGFALGSPPFLSPASASNDRAITFAAPTATPECAGAACDELLPPVVTGSLDEALPPDGYAVCQVDPAVKTALDLPRMPAIPCVGGQAGPYTCNNVDLQSFLPLNLIGGGGTNLASSLWGWTDSVTGREYALVGLRNRTSFVDITDSENPFYIGYLPSHTGTSSWRELKAYNNHAFIVSDSNANHGVQIFDLTQLRSYQTPPVTPVPFSETAHYNTVGSVHNIWVNEETGFAYAVGTRMSSQSAMNCSGGVHIFNVQNPANPTFSACYPATATTGYYTHDIDCMIYDGPDPDYQGHEICIASDGKSSNNNDSMAILDVTNKNAIVEVARVSYANDGFIHQTDFTEDMTYLVLDDELDETNNGTLRRTHIFNMTNLDSPQYVGYHQAGTAIDHNQYVKGEYLYQANYTEGLSVFTMENIGSGSLTPAGFFDFYTGNAASFNGAWNVYPYFDSGNVIMSSIEQGLFILRPALAQLTPTPSPTFTATRTPTATNTATATRTATNTAVPPTFTATATRTPSPTMTITVSPTRTTTRTPTVTATGSLPATLTATPENTPTAVTISPTPTEIPTITPTGSPLPSRTPTPTRTSTPAPTPTATKGVPPTVTATATKGVPPTVTATSAIPPTVTATATQGTPPTVSATPTSGLPPSATATTTPRPPRLYLPLVRAAE